MARTFLLRQWDEAWREGLWAAPWSRALEGLTPVQATWRPQPQRHCIWQCINHVMFWREVALRGLKGEKVGDEERESRNWTMPPTADDMALDDLRAAWHRSHEQVREALADESTDVLRLQYVAHHDSYHIGQIMLLRAMQGMPSIE